MKVLVVYTYPSYNIWGNIETLTEIMDGYFCSQIRDFIQEQNPTLKEEPILINLIKLD